MNRNTEIPMNIEEIVSRRKKIEQLVMEHRYEELSHLLGFSLVMTPEEALEKGGVDCSTYVFPELSCKSPGYKSEPLLPEKIKTQYMEVEKPENGDIVIYYVGNGIVHVGKFLGDGRVESKMGVGPVYQHNLMDVPAMYGEPKFYRKRVN